MRFIFNHFLLLILLTSSKVLTNNLSQEEMLPESTNQEVIPSMKQQEDVQYTYVPLTEEEAKVLLENFTIEEKTTFQNFFNKLSETLQSVRNTTEFKETEVMLEAKGVSLNIILNIVPTKKVNKPTESLEDNNPALN